MDHLALISIPQSLEALGLNLGYRALCEACVNSNLLLRIPLPLAGDWDTWLYGFHL
ncbi:hypothetical protein FA95DRAFT_1554350 [Auriscalpium vulgare]|uniref:Uncharacterized protein n=1 Tax=Auriscalpium vulgare TaxID=40419 RepID=A0ACB8S4Q1_9AGAM|nr:hypothetical protein FA95DRAFT_1554350 [Auriscalpium vulgare]